MENIRITSGELRGRLIKSPRSNLTHPMGAREKLALFNMLTDFLPEARVLDAFSGSGALGIEAISRGAGKAVFIEKNKKTSQVIRENIKALDLLGKTIVFAIDVKNFAADELFDIIIADPPYDNFNIEDILYLTGFLKDGGVLALSHPGDAPVIDGLNLTTSRKYAGATLSIYQK